MLGRLFGQRLTFGFWTVPDDDHPNDVDQDSEWLKNGGEPQERAAFQVPLFLFGEIAELYMASERKSNGRKTIGLALRSTSLASAPNKYCDKDFSCVFRLGQPFKAACKKRRSRVSKLSLFAAQQRLALVNAQRTKFSRA